MTAGARRDEGRDWTLPALVAFWAVALFLSSAMVLAEPAWLTGGSRIAPASAFVPHPAVTVGMRG